MLFTVRTEVARPPGEVFDKLSDCRNEERWNTQVSKAELVSDEPVQLGTNFRTINRGKTYEARIVTHERPERLAFDVVGKPMDIAASYVLRPDGDGVVIEGELEMKPKGMMRLVMPLAKSAIQKDLNQQYENFRALCESS